MELSNILFYSKNPKKLSLLIKRLSSQNAKYLRGRTVKEHRSILDSAAEVRPPVAGVIYEDFLIRDIKCRRLYTEKSFKPKKIVVYLHGGGWAFGNIKTATPFASLILAAMKCNVLVPEYKLSPEHVFPAALNDCLNVYKHLLAAFSAKDIAFIGDSAGGNLILCLLNLLKEQNMPQPACAACISPVTDMRENSAIVTSGDDLIYTIHNGSEEDIFTLYTNGADRNSPLLSPILGDLTGLSPILIHTGEDEPIAIDNIAYVKKALAEGSNVTIKIWRDMFHDFTVVGRTLHEGILSLREICRFTKRYLFIRS